LGIHTFFIDPARLTRRIILFYILAKQ